MKHKNNYTTQGYYDRHVKELKPIQPGQTVQMRLPGRDTWTTGTCTKKAGPRSYEVQMGGSMYRRNRRQLIQVDKDLRSEEPNLLTDETEVHRPPRPTPESMDMAEQEERSDTHPQDNTGSSSELLAKAPPRHSGRVTQRPSWMADYVPSGMLP